MFAVRLRAPGPRWSLYARVLVAIVGVAFSGCGPLGSGGAGSLGRGGGAGVGTQPAGGSPPAPPSTESCDTTSLCGGNSWFRICQAGAGQCRIERSDGVEEMCVCSQCAAELDDAHAWCKAEQASGGGSGGGSGSGSGTGSGSGSGSGSGTQPLGCYGFRLCLEAEYNANGGDFDAATATCGARAQSGAVQKWEAAVGCGQAWCLGQFGGGPSVCKLDATQSSIVNLDGGQASAGTPCGDCLENALARIFGGSCASAQYCNPVACQSATDACFNDLP